MCLAVSPLALLLSPTALQHSVAKVAGRIPWYIAIYMVEGGEKENASKEHAVGIEAAGSGGESLPSIIFYRASTYRRARTR